VPVRSRLKLPRFRGTTSAHTRTARERRTVGGRFAPQVAAVAKGLIRTAGALHHFRQGPHAARGRAARGRSDQRCHDRWNPLIVSCAPSMQAMRSRRSEAPAARNRSYCGVLNSAPFPRPQTLVAQSGACRGPAPPSLSPCSPFRHKEPLLSDDTGERRCARRTGSSLCAITHYTGIWLVRTRIPDTSLRLTPRPYVRTITGRDAAVPRAHCASDFSGWRFTET